MVFFMILNADTYQSGAVYYIRLCFWASFCSSAKQYLYYASRKKIENKIM